MLKNLARLLIAELLLFNCLNPALYAQEGPFAAPPPGAQSVMQPQAEPQGSAPLEEEFVLGFTPPPALPPAEEAAPAPAQEAPQYPFETPQSRGGFKLFEPSGYTFMQEDAPLMVPPAQSAAEENYDNYYRYSRAYLENAMAAVEGAVDPREREIEYLEILNPSLLLPIFGTTISLTGRKTFGFNYNARKYKGRQTIEDRSFSNFEMNQEMQIKLQGKISDRIFVDIDYDDQREDAQNISVSYRGKGEEFVQSADFGDIELSLPGTEFISYNKQVFGAKMHMRFKDAHLRLIGSQTKGETRSKQFKGDSVFETANVRDTQYIRRRYYDLSFDGLQTWAIAPNTERVYIDDHTTGGYLVAMTAQDLQDPSAVYPDTGGTAGFKLLTRGVDYVIDYSQKILIFNNSLKDGDVVAVDYENSQGQMLSNMSGTPGIAKIVKTSSDRPLRDAATEIGYKLEIKRYYDIGAQQITRDNGQGNFILKLLESDGREACPPTSAPQYCVFNIDYEKGIFNIRENFDDLGIYGATPTSRANRYFFVQFSSTVRTYFLEPDIVVQSEKVTINGAVMARNKDYYVDYASGFLTFYNENLIGANSVIDVTYEAAAVGGGRLSTLLGGRLSYDFTKNISVGGTFLHETGNQPKRVPNVGALASSLSVMEADLKAKDVEVADGVKLSLGVEAAQSKKDENLFGYAMIDNLEETKELVRASTAFSDWKIASNPTAGTSFYDAIKWDSEEVRTLDVNPQSAVRADARQVVLNINYDFTRLPPGYGAHDEVSLVFPISAQGVDFSNKTLLEFTMQGEENGPYMNISFGAIDERSDNYAYLPAQMNWGDIYPACSKYYAEPNPMDPSSFYVPKTEDLRCTGTLTPQEDSGWLFIDPDETPHRYNPFAGNEFNRLTQPNGLIDTQDLDGNGIFDSADFTAGGDFGFNGDALVTDSASYPGISAGSQIDYSGWRHFQRDVNFSDAMRWGSIKQMRITLKRGGRDKGTIKIANLSVSGSTWKSLDNAAAADENFFTYGINNIDNPGYKPIFNDQGDGGEVFRDLYGSVNEMRGEEGVSNIKEQSLAIKYDFAAAAQTDLNAQRNFSRMDFSQHREFRFLLYNNGPAQADASFYLRIATDDNNYNEVSIPLDFDSRSYGSGWRLYTLKMIDLNGDGVPERWENASAYGATTDALGSLSFNRVSTIKAGVRAAAPGSPAAGEVWLDEVHLADSVVTQGSAYMAEGKIDIENWLEAGGKYTYMDDTFQTPVAVPGKQKNERHDYYLKLKRFKHLPVEATYQKSNTITPDVLDYNSSNTVSLLDQGEVDRQKGSVRAQYINPGLPRIGVEYIFEETDFDKLQRNDDRKFYGATLDYAPASQKRFIRNISAGTSLNQSKIDYSEATMLSAPGGYYNTDETTQNYNLKLALQPWQGASIAPSYSLSLVDEKRRYYDDSATMFKNRNYSKSAAQNAGVTAALRLNKWLAPTAGYSVNIRENNNLLPFEYWYQDVLRTFEVGEVKSVNRTSEGNISLALNGREVFEKSKLLAGMTLSAAYKLQDGDTWENVQDGFNSLDKLWVRS
ncbi:MAG: hypothetical protein LBR90_05155, partial [Elusimicrobiota bacterium]|nr:hypothetical protein [Elusimicrobiota bacterium]